MFKAGVSYSDAAGDMAISFLDVVAFQATVDEEAQTVEVILKMRDIPENATRGQVKNLFEYSWTIFIYLDPATANPEHIPGDYYFGVNTSIPEPLAAGGLTPVPGTPVTVPIHQLLEVKYTYNSAGMSVSRPDVTADPNSDTLVLKGRVPKIKSNAVFSFSTNYYDRGQIESVAARTNATAVVVPSNVGGAPGTDTYLDLVTTWVRELASAFRGRASAHP